MFVEVFVKGFLWLLVCIIGACLAFMYCVVLPVIFAEIIFTNADIATYLVLILFFIALNFIFVIRFQDYKDKNAYEESVAKTAKLLKEKWGKDV